MTQLTPTPRQMEYHDWEFGLFMHFGIRTFYEGHRDWDGERMDPANFSPTATSGSRRPKPRACATPS